MMKSYENNIVGPDASKADLIVLDLEDVEIRFRLPEDSRGLGFLESSDTIKEWYKSQISGRLLVAELEWELQKIDDDGFKRDASTVFVTMMLRRIDNRKNTVSTNNSLEKTYNALKDEELQQYTIDVFADGLWDLKKEKKPNITRDQALSGWDTIYSDVSQLEITKRDLLPWYMTRKRQHDDSRLQNLTCIPLSENDVLEVLFDPIFYADYEDVLIIPAEKHRSFGDKLRAEFFEQLSVHYSDEIQEKIAQANKV